MIPSPGIEDLTHYMLQVGQAGATCLIRFHATRSRKGGWMRGMDAYLIVGWVKALMSMGYN